MTTEIFVPALGESVTEATIASWFKKPGDAVKADEPLVELETDKVTLEVPAPAAGTLSEIVAREGDTVDVGALLGVIAEGAVPTPAPAKKEAATPAGASGDQTLSPAVRKLVDENNIDPTTVSGSGKDGRLTKGDVLEHMEGGDTPAPSSPSAPTSPGAVPTGAVLHEGPREERVRMTRLRKTIARRLKDAQNTAAMLTTFNEVDMTAVMATRAQYKDMFLKKHGVKLGFMSFFTKAVCQALFDVPSVNAEIDGDDIVYKNHYDIGVAVGTDRGLVVPVLRNADRLSLAGIEKGINELGSKARDGKLSMEDMMGGTFTISNGGIYGSLMSTPILNAPQSGILGMHNIVQRPMVVGGEIKARPMMYLALSYDHRIVDGKEAVTFLVRVKESLEDPQRMILDL